MSGGGPGPLDGGETIGVEAQLQNVGRFGLYPSQFCVGGFITEWPEIGWCIHLDQEVRNTAYPFMSHRELVDDFMPLCEERSYPFTPLSEGFGLRIT